MATCLFAAVESDFRNSGWKVDGPFLPFHLGDGIFRLQTRVVGNDMGDTWSSFLESFSEFPTQERV